MDSSQFISALLAIIVIDLVLAGDNAIVIALAARSLPVHLQRRAIIWGAFGAIAVRSLMTVIVVWLLKIPGLLVAGGVLLLWIAYRLLLPESDESDPHAPAATNFWGAMRTIVIADAVMGLDNVLAVAGAAHGSYLLVVTGLLISIPIVVWGSTVVLKVVDRYPAVVYLGAAVLVWTAARMIQAEPLLESWWQRFPTLSGVLYLLIPLILWAGFRVNHRRWEKQIQGRLAGMQLPGSTGSTGSTGTDAASEAALGAAADAHPLRVLIPVDGSENALNALRHAVAEYRRRHELELHLLNVQPLLTSHIGRFVSRRDLESFHRERADAALAGAVALLEATGVPYHVHRAIGDRAAQIYTLAQSLGAHHIVMGTARKDSLTRMLEDSVTNQVLQVTRIPVEVVSGDAVSRWERWVVPVGLLAVIALLWLTAD